MSALMQYLVAVLCALAILTGQFFYGGGALRPVFALPSYLVISLAGVVTGIWLLVRRPGGVSWACFVSALAFVSWVCWRCAAAPEMASAENLLTLSVGCLVIYLIFAFGVTQPLPRLTFVAILIAAACVQAIFGAAQFRGIGPPMPQGWYSEILKGWYEPKFAHASGLMRARGLYLNANHLAWFLNAAGLFALTLGSLGRFRAWCKILAIYLGVVLLAADLLCMSRGGWLALAAGLGSFAALGAVTIWVGAPARRVAMLVVVCAALIIPAGAGWLVFSQSSDLRFRLGAIFNDPFREQVWNSVLRQMQLDPIFGAGPGAFASYARQFKDVIITSDELFAHNDWAQITADFGFPALALLLLAVIIHLSRGFTGFVAALRQRMALSAVPQSTSAALSAGAFTATIAFVVHSFFDFNLQIPANALLAAACAGFLVFRVQDRPSFAPLRHLVPLAILAAAVTLGAASWHARSQIHALWAENHLLRGEFLSGRAEAQKGILDDQRSSQLHLLLGESFIQESNAAASRSARLAALRRALPEIQRAIQLSPHESRNYLFLSQVFRNLGQAGPATDAALESIRLDPMRASGYEMFALACDSSFQVPLALRSFEISFYLSGGTIDKSRYRQLLERSKPVP